MEKSVRIRRYVAVGLMLLSILMLFWPSIVKINGKSDAFDAYTSRMKALGKADFARQFAQEWKYSFDYIGALEVSEAQMREAEDVGRGFYDFLMKDGYTLSYLKACLFFPKLIRYAHIDAAIPLVTSILLWLGFSLLLLLAVGAILMMLFNKPKVFNILHVVFSFLIATVFLFLGLCGPIMTVADSSVKIAPVYPGAAAVLLPLFSLAALIVYKRIRVKKAAPQPAAAPVWQQPVVPQQPTSAAWTAPQPTASMRQQPQNDWFCTACGTRNTADSYYCENCGQRRS